MKEDSIVVGLDLGDKVLWYCALDSSGEVIGQGSMKCTEPALRDWFGNRKPALVAIEAGTHSPWISRVLTELGHSVLVGNPRKLRMIYANERKSDRKDAEMLARIARMDPQLLYPVVHRGKQAQADLALLKSRNCLVETRTKLINHVRGLVKSFGGRVPSCSAPAFSKRAEDAIPEELGPAIRPCLEMLASLTDSIRAYDKQVEALCAERYPETQLVRSIQGVGSVTSLTYVLTLEEAQRFAHSRTVPAYLGLIPRSDQSGESNPQLRITKTGNSYLRKLLVGSAQYILGPHGQDSALRQWGLKLAERGGANAKKRAVVAVARKLAVLMHRLWINGELYEPFPDHAQGQAS